MEAIAFSISPVRRGLRRFDKPRRCATVLMASMRAALRHAGIDRIGKWRIVRSRRQGLSDQQRDLAFNGFAGHQHSSNFGGRTAQKFLVEFGQLARHHHRPISQRLLDGFERIQNAVRGFVEDQRIARPSEIARGSAAAARTSG